MVGVISWVTSWRRRGWLTLHKKKGKMNVGIVGEKIRAKQLSDVRMRFKGERERCGER